MARGHIETWAWNHVCVPARPLIGRELAPCGLGTHTRACPPLDDGCHCADMALIPASLPRGMSSTLWVGRNWSSTFSPGRLSDKVIRP